MKKIAKVVVLVVAILFAVIGCHGGSKFKQGFNIPLLFYKRCATIKL